MAISLDLATLDSREGGNDGLFNTLDQAWSELSARAFYLLRDQTCSYCQSPINTWELLCTDCRGSTLALRSPEPLTDLPGVIRYAATSGSSAVQELIYDWKFRKNPSARRVTADVILSYWWLLTAALTNRHGLSPNAGPIWFTTIPSRQSHRVMGVFSRQPPLDRIANRVIQLEQKYPLTFVPQLITWQSGQTVQQNKLLRRQDRFTNLKQAFLPPTVKQFHQYCENAGVPQAIVVLDDLTTTGATLQAAIKAIQQGAKVAFKDDFPVIGLAALHIPLKVQHDDLPSEADALVL